MDVSCLLIGTTGAEDKEFIRQLALVLVDDSLSTPGRYKRIDLLNIWKHRGWFKDNGIVDVDIS